MRDPALNYRPSNLSDSFHHQVAELPANLPDHLPHTR
jgi:hypothetical protein